MEIEMKRVIRRTVSEYPTMYSAEPARVVREVVLWRLPKADRTLSRRQRRSMKNRAIGRVQGVPNINL